MRKGPTHFNGMHPLHWIPASSSRLLDVGCNVGELLKGCAERLSSADLAGVEVNPAAVARARERVNGVDIRLVEGSNLPFPNASFDYVTCIEMLEHVPLRDRSMSLSEICRVLAPGGSWCWLAPTPGCFRGAMLRTSGTGFRVYIGLAGGSGLRDSAYFRGIAPVHRAGIEGIDPAELEVELRRRLWQLVVCILMVAHKTKTSVNGG
jgi:SAM-dependent methyltransferase